ncbi:MAG TPA: hypothetical protein VF656_04335 [Pyrinomonadaceae bacterium]|jgi:protein tyrosine phosphatase (PTP) superfamily phosphohydrolase (DUF442 family)
MNNDYTPVKVNAPIVTNGQNCWRIGNFYVTAQPTDPQGLNTAQGLGIKSVICLRDATEQAVVEYLPFDPKEDIVLTSLGVNFANIPFPHGIPQNQFDTRAGAVLAVLNQLPQPLLMHCSSGDRASALWAIHLMVDDRLPKQAAINYAELSGLKEFLPYVQNYAS